MNWPGQRARWQSKTPPSLRHWCFGDRPIAQLDPIERAVLWIGMAQLKGKPETPVKVVINEAIELSKTFGAEGGFKYINGVLDKAATALR